MNTIAIFIKSPLGMQITSFHSEPRQIHLLPLELFGIQGIYHGIVDSSHPSAHVDVFPQLCRTHRFAFGRGNSIPGWTISLEMSLLTNCKATKSSASKKKNIWRCISGGSISMKAHSLSTRRASSTSISNRSGTRCDVPLVSDRSI